MAGSARFQNMNPIGSMPNGSASAKATARQEQMPKNGNKPLAMDAAEGSIVVSVPVAEVYKRWVAFEDYPKFITAIKRVRRLDQNHFVASLAFNGKEYETTLEMMLCVPERRLAWRTLADHRARDHFAAGVVSFAPLSERSTCVNFKLTSSFGGAVSRRIAKYLQNFKRLIENQGGRNSPPKEGARITTR
jgi:uncharacterized membrane protein